MANQETEMENVKSSSDRSFGFVFTVVFLLITVWPYYDGGAPNFWAAGTGSLFLMTALLRPVLLAPLNRLWTRFGLLLNKVTSPIILGLLFFGVMLPISLLMRLFGKRPLQLSYDQKTSSYWIVREPTGPAPETMKQQF